MYERGSHRMAVDGGEVTVEECWADPEEWGPEDEVTLYARVTNTSPDDYDAGVVWRVGGTDVLSAKGEAPADAEVVLEVTEGYEYLSSGGPGEYVLGAAVVQTDLLETDGSSAAL